MKESIQNPASGFAPYQNCRRSIDAQKASELVDDEHYRESIASTMNTHNRHHGGYRKDKFEKF
jgi:hypothetical protein